MTTIEWTRNPDGSKGKSWNPIRARNRETGRLGHHCEHVNEACRYCYAEKLNLNERNLPFGGTGLPFKPGHLKDVEIFLDEDKLLDPLSWRKSQRVFVDSMDDPFGRWVKDEWLDRLFAVMALCPHHTFILLTKRPARMRAYLTDDGRSHAIGSALGDMLDGKWIWKSGKRYRAQIEGMISLAHGLGPDSERQAFEDFLPLPNVWLLVSCAEQKDVDEFVPILLTTPAALHGVSLEPLIGFVDLERVRGANYVTINALTGEADLFGNPEERLPFKLGWVLCGGESGLPEQDVRAMHPHWPLSVRDACSRHGVPFFFKQWGEYSCIHKAEVGDMGRVVSNGVGDQWNVPMARVGKKRAGRLLDGVEHNEFPNPNCAAQAA